MFSVSARGSDHTLNTRLYWLYIYVVSYCCVLSGAACGFCSDLIHCVTQTTGNYKLSFGKGTKLNVETSEYEKSIKCNSTETLG